MKPSIFLTLSFSALLLMTLSAYSNELLSEQYSGSALYEAPVKVPEQENAVTINLNGLLIYLKVDPNNPTHPENSTFPGMYTFGKDKKGKTKDGSLSKLSEHSSPSHKRAKSEGQIPFKTPTLCSSAPQDHFDFEAKSTAIFLQVPPPVTVPGAMQINPDLAASQLSDQLAEYLLNPTTTSPLHALASFYRSALPGADLSLLSSNAQKVDLPRRYSTTFGVLKPSTTSDGSVSHHPLSSAGPAYEGDRRGASAAPSHLVIESTLFGHFRYLRNYLGFKEMNHGIDYRTTPYAHHRELQQSSYLNSLHDLFRHLSTLVAIAGNVAKVPVPELDYESFFRTEDNHSTTVMGAPPELLDFLTQVIFWHLFDGIQYVTDQEGFLNLLADVGSLFNFIHPFTECNEYTLNNLLLTIANLYSSNTEQLDFDSFRFTDKESLFRLIQEDMLEALRQARQRNGEFLEQPEVNVDSFVTGTPMLPAIPSITINSQTDSGTDSQDEGATNPFLRPLDPTVRSARPVRRRSTSQLAKPHVEKRRVPDDSSSDDEEDDTDKKSSSSEGADHLLPK